MLKISESFCLGGCITADDYNPFPDEYIVPKNSQKQSEVSSQFFLTVRWRLLPQGTISCQLQAFQFDFHPSPNSFNSHLPAFFAELEHHPHSSQNSIIFLLECELLPYAPIETPEILVSLHGHETIESTSIGVNRSSGPLLLGQKHVDVPFVGKFTHRCDINIL